MESDGQRAASNPSAMLAALITKRDKLQDELQIIERQVYDLETTYLQDSNQHGSVLKGFEGFLSSSKSTANFYQSVDRIIDAPSFVPQAAVAFIEDLG